VLGFCIYKAVCKQRTFLSVLHLATQEFISIAHLVCETWFRVILIHLCSIHTSLQKTNKTLALSVGMLAVVNSHAIYVWNRTECVLLRLSWQSLTLYSQHGYKMGSEVCIAVCLRIQVWVVTLWFLMFWRIVLPSCKVGAHAWVDSSRTRMWPYIIILLACSLLNIASSTVHPSSVVLVKIQLRIL